MLNLFKKKVEKELAGACTNQLGMWVSERLRAFAVHLNQKAEGADSSTIMIVSTLACFIFSILLGFTVKQTLSNNAEIHIQPIQGPVVPSIHFRSEDNIVYERIRRFQGYLDSLKQHDSLHYKDVMEARPHLLDSLVKVEQLINE